MSDIDTMAPIELQKTEHQTKQCPFCAEIIQARAIKCRFCGEFLDSERAKALTRPPQEQLQAPQAEAGADVYPFLCGPSMWSIAPDVLKSLLVLLLSMLLAMLRFEKAIDALPGVSLTQAQASTFASYRIVLALGFFLGVVVYIGIKVANVLTTYYEVSPNRVEWGRGIFNKKVDNLDMFRIVDMKLRRTATDSVLGIGSVVLITSDKTDPEFVFDKIRRPREVYDVLKKASLQADRRGSVVHLE